VEEETPSSVVDTIPAGTCDTIPCPPPEIESEEDFDSLVIDSIR
jgi:hypothetical protein